METPQGLNALLHNGRRPGIVDALAGVVDQTVADQSGLTGMALRSAIAGVKKVDARILHKGINTVLPQLLEQLNPRWEDYKNSDHAAFGEYLAQHEDDVVTELVSLGDNLRDSMPAGVQKIYATFRSKAAKIVGPALPRIGEVVEKQMED